MSSTSSFCVICQDQLQEPSVSLPCGHRFCYDCLEGWRSRFDAFSDRTCPECRGKIPVTSDMVTQLEVQQHILFVLETVLNNPPYQLPKRPEDPGYSPYDLLNDFIPADVEERVRSLPPDQQQEALKTCFIIKVEILEFQIHQLQEIIDDSPGLLPDRPTQDQVLPESIADAAAENNVAAVLSWLGPLPVEPAKINAINPAKMGRTLLHEATFEQHLCLMALLLQAGANVDPKSSREMTPLTQACSLGLEQAARVLLSWGADKEYHHDGDSMVEIAKEGHNKSLVNLIRAPLGGRRCEFLGLNSRPDLNGLRCIVSRYIANEDKYIVDVELTKEKLYARPANLQRCDRTPQDCGQYLILLQADSATHQQQWNTALITRNDQEREAVQRANSNASS